MSQAGGGRTVYVAPHPDDAALSCGGTVAIEARQSDPLIVTLFAGQPVDDIPAFARQQHEWWGVEARDAIAQRRAEDERASRALGEEVEPLWLDFLDAIYRNPAYNSDETLFGTLQESDLPVVEEIATQLIALNGGEYLVPLAVGNHVDHQLAFRAGGFLARMGAVVWAYADVPYVFNPRALTPRLATGTVRDVRVTYLDAEAFERKCTAIDCYRSQLPVIFRDHGNHRIALANYHRQVGGGRMAEVAWRVQGI